jgi:hypothetical protein
MSNPLATTLHKACDIIATAGIRLFTDKAEIAILNARLSQFAEVKDATPKQAFDANADVASLKEALTTDIPAIRNRFVSDACSSRDGSAIATTMALAKVSHTVAHAKARVNAKAADATQAYAKAVAVIDLAEKIVALHSIMDTGWTLDGSPTGQVPRKFAFATAVKESKSGLTDKQLAAERPVDNSPEAMAARAAK